MVELVDTAGLGPAAKSVGVRVSLWAPFQEINMSMQETVLSLVKQISSVNLSHAFVSIELESANELIQFLALNKISANLTHWNAPKSLYIGEKTPDENLIVLSLSW